MLPFSKNATAARSTTISLAHNPSPNESTTKKPATAMDKLPPTALLWAYDLVKSYPGLGADAIKTKIAENHADIIENPLPAKMTVFRWRKEVLEGVVVKEDGVLKRTVRKNDTKFLLTQNEEDALAEHIRICADTWKAVPVSEMDAYVVEILHYRQFMNRQIKTTKNPKYVPLRRLQKRAIEKNLVTRRWRRRFLKDHDLLAKMTSAVDAKRSAKATRAVAERHLEQLAVHLKKARIMNEEGVIVRPDALLNFDEVGQFYSKSHKREYMVTPKRVKPKRAEHIVRKQFTFTGVTSALGRFHLPQVIYAGKLVQQGMFPDTIPGKVDAWHVNVTDHGCQTCPSLVKYLRVLLPEIRQSVELGQHVVLMVDGHGSRAAAFGARETKGVLDQYNASYNFLPPNSSGTLQPMDQLYHSFHSQYDRARTHYTSLKPEVKTIKTADVALILRQAVEEWMNAHPEDTVQRLWFRCGVGRECDVRHIPSDNLRDEPKQVEKQLESEARDDARVTRATSCDMRMSEELYIKGLNALFKEERAERHAHLYVHSGREKLGAAFNPLGRVSLEGECTDAIWDQIIASSDAKAAALANAAAAGKQRDERKRKSEEEMKAKEEEKARQLAIENELLRCSILDAPSKWESKEDVALLKRPALESNLRELRKCIAGKVTGKGKRKSSSPYSTGLTEQQKWKNAEGTLGKGVSPSSKRDVLVSFLCAVARRYGQSE